MKNHITVMLLITLLYARIGVPPAFPEGGGPINPPKDGYVSDESTAIKIAEAILTPLFGEKFGKPSRALLNDGTWSLYFSNPPTSHTIIVKISKEDGRIISVSAYK